MVWRPFRRSAVVKDLTQSIHWKISRAEVIRSLYKNEYIYIRPMYHSRNVSSRSFSFAFDILSSLAIAFSKTRRRFSQPARFSGPLCSRIFGILQNDPLSLFVRLPQPAIYKKPISTVYNKRHALAMHSNVNKRCVCKPIWRITLYGICKWGWYVTVQTPYCS